MKNEIFYISKRNVYTHIREVFLSKTSKNSQNDGTPEKHVLQCSYHVTEKNNVCLYFMRRYTFVPGIVGWQQHKLSLCLSPSKNTYCISTHTIWVYEFKRMETKINDKRLSFLINFGYPCKCSDHKLLSCMN